MITLREEKGTQLTHAEMDENWKSVMGGHNFLHIQDQKTAGTNGGTFTAGAWRTRDLNTVLTNTITDASLEDNQITLPAGKYYVEASAPALRVRNHGAILYNVSDSVVIIDGTTESSWEDTNIMTISRVLGLFDLPGEKSIELRHRCRQTDASGGFGASHTDAGLNKAIYSDIRIWRIGEYVAP